MKGPASATVTLRDGQVVVINQLPDGGEWEMQIPPQEATRLGWRLLWLSIFTRISGRK